MRNKYANKGTDIFRDRQKYMRKKYANKNL